MADDALAPTGNPFDDLDPDKVGTIAPPKEEPAPINQLNMGAPAAPPAGNDNQEKNPFDEFGEVGQTTTTAKGAFARGAERGIVPAATGMVGAGLGAAGVVAAGAAAGTTIGPWGTVAGGIGGALVGGYFGSAAQDWALKKLPDSWVDALGMDDRQQRLDETQHSTASFLGGLTPYAVTMRPSLSFAATKLPENATGMQKIMANPVTARLFGGAANGGMELGMEAVHGDVDWSKVAISTVFGVVFDKPTKIGQALTNLGERPFRPATVAQAGDAKVMGPGVTESVFQGTHEQAPHAAMTAQEAARTEHAVLGEAAEPDVHAVAKQMHPELFDRYDELLKQRDVLSAWHGEGGGAEAAERHLAATNAELHEIAPEISAAYRRAAETTGIETVEPEPFPSFAAMLAAHEHGGGNVEARAVPQVPPEPPLGETAGVPGVPGVPAGGEAPGSPGGPAGTAAPVVPAPQRPLGEQKAFIADDVAQKLIAAGRPADEAQASGQVVAARYATRAGRFEGKLGTAEELYRKQGAAIAGPDGKPIASNFPIKETEQEARFRTGYDHIVRVDAAKLREAAASRATGGLTVNPEKLEAVRKSGAGSGYPRVDVTKGKVSIEDGVHRTTVAGERGQTIDVAVKSPKEAAALQKIAGVSPDLFTEAQAKDLEHIAHNGFTPRTAAEDLQAEKPSKISTGYNAKTGKTGAPLRAGKYQDWEPGRIVKVGFVDGLKVEGTVPPETPGDAAGFVLTKGENVYLMTPHKGMAKLEPADATAALRQARENAVELQQPKELEQTAQGSINLNPKGVPGRNYLGVSNANPIMRLFKLANASTPMHEFSHTWLAELLRDAAHSEAPDVIKQDAAATLKWIGAETPEGVRTKHHEKFARGFEQYLREGVAPSQGLARVFSQFRNWLLTIYQSIKGLGTEISPEIRGVFDRMLEMEPKRTVIAPEERAAGGPTLHEIHEGDAAHAEPHEAEALADRAAAERDRYIQEPPPEIANEIAASIQKVEAEQAARAGTEPGAEAVEGASGQPEVVGGGGGPEPEPAGGGMGAGGGKVSEGRGEPTPEGAAPDRRSKLGDNPGTALAPGPTDLFGATESPFTDKAGNIRLENLNTTEDVKRALRDAAAENNDFIGDRRGVVTDGQVMELADALGMDAEQISHRKIGQAFNAEQIVAARKLLIESATQVSAAMKKAAIGTDEDVMAYAMAKDRHQMIQAQVSGITAEAGRALRAFRKLPGQEAVAEVEQMLKEATGKTLFQLKQEAKLGATLQTPQQVSKFMHDAGKASFGRMVLEMWINGILSGPATHMTNIIGNTILAVQHFGPETAIAAMVGRAAKALGREGTYTRLGEMGAAARGIGTGIAPAIEATGEALRRGTSTLLPGETARPLDVQPHDALAQKATLNEATTMGDVVHSAFSVFRGIQDGMLAGGALIKAGGVEGSPVVGTRYSHLGAIPDIEVRGVNVLPIGTVTRAPGRFLAAADTFFRSTTYAMSKNAIAYRMASDEGLTGAAFDRRVAEIRTSSDPAVMEQARASATEMTLMNRGGQFVQAMNHLTSATINLPLIGEIPPLKFINPFVNIAGQIINQSIIKRSPVGLLSPELRADLMGKNGNIAQDVATARMLMGTAVAVTLGGLAAGGYASGSGPKKPDEAAMWRLAGNQAHSVRIGDLWYDVSKLGPIGMLMGLAADMYDVSHKAAEGEYSEAAAYLHHAISQNILDQSFLKGPADLIQAIEDPERYGGRYVRNFLSSFIPYSNALAQTARREDPYMRQTRTVLEAIQAKIPGMSESLFPRRDIWGEPMAQRQALGGTGVTGIYAKHMSTDPVNKAMLDLGISPGAVDKKIRNIELTPQQYDDFARIAGRSTKMRLDAIVRSPDFQTWAPGTKHEVIAETVKQSREAARGMILMKYPDLVHAAVEDRIAHARGEKKKK